VSIKARPQKKIPWTSGAPTFFDCAIIHLPKARHPDAFLEVSRKADLSGF
jgi:hypothetical protein